MEQQDKHRKLWRGLKLTCDGPEVGGDSRDGPLEGDGIHGDVHPQGGGGAAHLQARPHISTAGDDLEHVDKLDIEQNLQNISKEEDRDTLPGGRGQPGHGGGEQSPVAVKKRRYFRKLKGGETRGGLKQIDISMYTIPKIMGEGGCSADNNFRTETETVIDGGKLGQLI